MSFMLISLPPDYCWLGVAVSCISVTFSFLSAVSYSNGVHPSVKLHRTHLNDNESVPKIKFWTELAFSPRSMDISHRFQDLFRRPSFNNQPDFDIPTTWYNWWLIDQVKKQPVSLFSTLSNFDPDSYETWLAEFLKLWEEIELLLSNRGQMSIEEITCEMRKASLVGGEEQESVSSMASDMVFAILGWQTMLYKSDFKSCSDSQLCIADETSGYRGQAHISLRQMRSACKKRLPDFLLGFGLMLPPPNICTLDSAEDKEAFEQMDVVEPTSFNAKLLSVVCGFSITWIDSLSCHMELDIASKTLFLFRYPSFCKANLAGDESASMKRSAIYSCAGEGHAARHWATEEDVEQLLREILLSYRLLFGQTKQSRRYFRKQRPFLNIPSAGRDAYLIALCSQKSGPHMLDIDDMDAYSLKRDFPHLRSRLVRLLAHLSRAKPRTWRELWLDNRDSAAWLTFWAVIIIGGLGVFFAFLQVLLQILQLVVQFKQN